LKIVQGVKFLKDVELKGAEKLIAPLIALLGFVFFIQWLIRGDFRSSFSDPTFNQQQPPLIMKGGDPYIRALMRTISASESNTPRPYSVLYGGKNHPDLSRHPQECVTIVNGPNKGNCSTAAGRYQIINTTWYQIAPRYHPNPPKFTFWSTYSFEPEYQDIVVHRWLSDSRVWGANIPQLLRQGKINNVLKLLSPTWTSLGYGIENNSMSRYLPNIYQKVLQDELNNSKNPSIPTPKPSPI
jgi:muramidase (phage lysozyme)